MNGYSNDETWAFAALVDNNEYALGEVNSMAGHYSNDEDDVEFFMDDLIKFARLNSDLFEENDIDIEEVDFHEIAQTWLAD